LDKLVVVSGCITAALGIGFLVVHSMYPMLSDAYVSGGAGGIIIGAGMIMWGRRLGIKKDVEQMR
jgi:C4-dicarboxylate transporter